MKGGFSLIGDILNVTIPLPADLPAGVRLESASDEQIVLIKENFPRNVPVGDRLRECFEFSWSMPTAANNLSSSATELARQDWRYFVLTFAGQTGEHNIVKQLLTLTAPSLTIVQELLTSEEFGRGEWRGGMTTSEHFSGAVLTPIHFCQPAILLEQSAIDDLFEMYDQLRSSEAQHPWILRALNSYCDVRRLPIHSPLTTLGYFAILEMILTHDPAENGNIRTLTHQLRKKIPLVTRRPQASLDYSPFGNQVNEEKVWTLLYAFRSAVAHGAEPDFANKLLLLGHSQRVHAFLRNATRAILRHCLREPQLVADLRTV